MSDDVELDIRNNLRPLQEIGFTDLSGDELLHVLSLFDRYGVWALNIKTSLLYWTDDIYRIHGMEVTPGPVDMKAALTSYHPEDIKILTQLYEEAVAQKSGFRFVFRLKRNRGGFKFVKSTGRYRMTNDGVEQIIGTFSEFQTPKRAIGSVTNVASTEASELKQNNFEDANPKDEAFAK